MSSRRFTQVGIDRLIRYDWMKKTSALVLAGNTRKDIKDILQQDLQESFRTSKADIRGSLDKTITILMKVWVTTPKELASLRRGGMELLKEITQSQSMAIHWGMVMAVYPFWSSVSTQVGRFLRLQDSVAASHVQRRMREQYGQRETVSRRTRYILRSFIDWGVLKESEAKGIYCAGTSVTIEEPRLISWLIEAQLYNNQRGWESFSALSDSLCLFPFRFARIGCRRVLALSDQLEMLVDGSAEDMIALRNALQRKT